MKKQPVIRPGQRRPFVKSTQAEVERRVELVEAMLGAAMTKTQIHRACETEFKVGWKQADEYIGRAERMMQKRLNRSRDEHRADALACYRQVLKSKDARTSDKIRARQRIDELLGLDAPRRTELTGADGSPLQIEARKKEPFDERAYLEMRRRELGVGVPAPDGAGQPVHPADADGAASGVPGRNGD